MRFPSISGLALLVNIKHVPRQKQTQAPKLVEQIFISIVRLSLYGTNLCMSIFAEQNDKKELILEMLHAIRVNIEETVINTGHVRGSRSYAQP